MTKSNTPERDVLDRLTDALVEDILSMSDEDILTEFREEGGDPEVLRREMSALFEKSLLIANKRRMAAAKAGAAADRAGRPSTAPVNIATARERLRAIIANPPPGQELTLAARNENELSDADVLGTLMDLQELDLLPSETGDDDRKRR